MSNTNNGIEDDDNAAPQRRPPSPPPHTTFSARGVHTPTFSAFRPRDMKIVSTQAINHAAWNCDGQRIGVVGIDKLVRVWTPEKSMELRSAQIYSSGHSDDVDFISWNPTHPDLFCTSSSRDKRIVFWDARQSRPVQSISVRYIPVQTVYSPDGRILIVFSSAKVMYCLRFGKQTEDSKPQWYQAETLEGLSTSSAIFSPDGDALVVAMNSESSIKLISFPSEEVLQSLPAHIHGCVAIALDPRGRYVATGGKDSIVNLFDTQEWICVRTITVCNHGITALSFSYDGEFIAIASTGSYIDICATETGVPLHRIPALGESRTVQWHPSKHLIAFCGQTAPKETGLSPVAWFSLFGPGM